jgi:gamma-F420-2:alpha-L-glutamate ligase
MKIWILAKRGWAKSHMNLRFKEVAKDMGLECYVVNPEDFDIIATKEGKSSIYYNGENIKLPDCLLPRMGSGTTYFACAVTRHLENLGVLVLNSSQSIELSKDKLATLQYLTSNNIPIPKTILAKFPINMKIIEKEFSYPIILKTVSGSFGKGVFLCEKRTKLQDTLDLIEASKDPTVNIILQEFVKSSKGRDIRVIVIGGRPLGAMLRTAKRGKFKANYSAGGNVSPLPMDPTIEWLAVESARILNLDIAGVDILFDGNKYVVCEVNSAPGFEGFEKATGINVPKAIFEYIKIRLGQNPLLQK